MEDNESLCSFNVTFVTLPGKDPRNLATFRAIFALFVVHTHIHTHSHTHTLIHTLSIPPRHVVHLLPLLPLLP